jgi:serine protease Do
VSIRSRSGGGSGVIWSADGLIITNHHVVPGDSAEVTLQDDRVFPARVIDRDPEHDLAALRIDAIGLDAAVPALTPLRTGEMVFAIGNPWGVRGTVTAGIVLTTAASAPEDGRSMEGLIRADLRLAPGNSGGPLVNARGEVVGINSMIAGGVALAVPVAAVIAFATREAEPEPGFLGVLVEAVPLPEAIAASYALPEAAGLMLTGIEPGSPAEAAGLIPGDIVVGIDAQRGLQALGRGLSHMRAGHPVRLALLRGGKPHETDATPAVRA